MQTSYCCPKCANENVYSLPVVHEQGRSRISLSGLTYDGELGAFGGSATSSSSLSQRCAPPEKPRFFLLLLLGVACWFFGEFLIKFLLSAVIVTIIAILGIVTGFTVSLFNINLLELSENVVGVAGDNIDDVTNIFTLLKPLLVVPFVYYLYRIWYYRNWVWTKKYQRWRNSYICLRCNSVF